MSTKQRIGISGIVFCIATLSGCTGIPYVSKGGDGHGPDMRHAGGPVVPGTAKPGPWGGAGPLQGPIPAGGAPLGPVNMGPPPFPGTQSEQAAFVSQKMADMDDERKTLATRITQLEAQLRDKDRALVQASFELQEATSQITRTREDLDRWKGEMEKLRTRLRSMEKDSKVTLETIINSLEQFLDRNPEARRPANVEELILPKR